MLYFLFNSTPTSPVEITEYENIGSDLISTISETDTTETNHIENVTINNSNWIFQVSAVLFIIVCAVSMLVIYCRKGKVPIFCTVIFYINIKKRRYILYIQQRTY